MTTARAFRGYRFPADVILWAVRWYLQFPVSYRDLERMLADRGVMVDHVSLFRWVQRFALELDKADATPPASLPRTMACRRDLPPGRWPMALSLPGSRWHRSDDRLHAQRQAR
ncbi:hypothetical protein [Marinivivus vitaminiproducens]|uniref:hypothetical protein n=1 Tax=Marinivivus vitaminiproducens TaxID=3035935 RepID=UPI003FA1806D